MSGCADTMGRKGKEVQMLPTATKLGSIASHLKGSEMSISNIFSFLTYPTKNVSEDAEMSGAAITPDGGKLSKMLGENA